MKMKHLTLKILQEPFVVAARRDEMAAEFSVDNLAELVEGVWRGRGLHLVWSHPRQLRECPQGQFRQELWWTRDQEDVLEDGSWGFRDCEDGQIIQSW